MNACTSTVTIVSTSSRTPRIRRKGARLATATGFFVALLLLCATSEQATARTVTEESFGLEDSTSAVERVLPTSATLGLNANSGTSGDKQLSITGI